MLPGMTEASSLMISPNKLLVMMTPLRPRGFLTMIMAALSISWWSTSSWGYSFANTSETVLRQRRLVASTLALSKLQTFAGGLRASAREAPRRAIRSISERL